MFSRLVETIKNIIPFERTKIQIYEKIFKIYHEIVVKTNGT
jgi:hypothetical protein